MQSFEIVAKENEFAGQFFHRLLERDDHAVSVGDDHALQRAARLLLVAVRHQTVTGFLFNDSFFILHDLFGVNDFIVEQEVIERLGSFVNFGHNTKDRSLAGQLGKFADIILRCDEWRSLNILI